MIAVRPINGRLPNGVGYSVKEGRMIPEWLMKYLDMKALIEAGAIKDDSPKVKTEAKPKADKKSDD